MLGVPHGNIREKPGGEAMTSAEVEALIEAIRPINAQTSQLMYARQRQEKQQADCEWECCFRVFRTLQKEISRLSDINDSLRWLLDLYQSQPGESVIVSWNVPSGGK